ncbi:MAG: hypothetical protein ACKVJA_01835, partial [Flavobacteriales bacterium]
PEINQTKSKNDIADFIWSVKNNCQYSITVYHNGLSSGSAIILPGVTKSIKLIPGAYRVVAKVNDNSANVTPFSGWKRLKKGHEAITEF